MYHICYIHTKYSLKTTVTFWGILERCFVNIDCISQNWNRLGLFFRVSNRDKKSLELKHESTYLCFNWYHNNFIYFALDAAAYVKFLRQNDSLQISVTCEEWSYEGNTGSTFKIFIFDHSIDILNRTYSLIAD